MNPDNEEIEWLNKADIEAVLSESSKKKLIQLEVFRTIDSTNNYLLSLAKKKQPPIAVCLAEEQTQGRGRQGKSWFSPQGTHIYGSLLWNFPKDKMEISHLSLAVAVMIVKALQKYGVDHKLKLKWPNDIYFANRKLAGILIEGIPTAQHTYPVVIGFGINLRSMQASHLAKTAISLEEIIGRRVERNKLAGLIIDELMKKLPIYTRSGFSDFLSDWHQHDLLIGKFVVIRTPQQEIVGIAQGVSETGELFIRDQHGQVRSYRCGEVSVQMREQDD